MLRRSADLRRLLRVLALFAVGLCLITVGLIAAAGVIGQVRIPQVLAYVDFDLNTPQRDLILLDYDHLIQIRRSLQVDIGKLDWTQHRLIAMPYGIGGQWQSFDSYAALPQVEMRGEHEFNWHWSPDERYLAYSAYNPQTGMNHLLVKDTQTGSVSQIQQPESSSHQPLLWSPDSRALIYQYQPLTGMGSLYLYLPETGADHQIAADANEAAWSPDGSRILYTRFTGGSLSPRVEIYNMETGEHRPLLPDDEYDQRSAVWSPDGAWIALAYDDALAVVREDGSDLHRLTTPFFVSSPLWSPDGHSLIFMAGSGLTSLFHIRDVQAAIDQASETGQPILDALTLTLDRQIFGVLPIWQPVDWS